MLYPSVSVIVTTYNRKKYLQHVLEHYRNVTDYPNYKLIVCDDCSNDGTQEYLRENPGLYDGLFISNANLGVTNSRNQGVVRNPADFYALIDDDTMHRVGWLSEAVNILTTWKDIGAVTTQRPLYELLEHENIYSALDLQLIKKDNVQAMLIKYIGSSMVFSHEVWHKVGAMSHPEKRSGICRYSDRISKAGYKVARTYPAFSESIDMPSHPLSLRFTEYNDSYTTQVAPESMQNVGHYNKGIDECMRFYATHKINDDGYVVEI